MVLSLVGIVSWEAFGREELLFTEVLVLNQDTEPYTLITKDMLAVKKVYKPNSSSYTIENVEDVVGKQSTQFIPMASELHERYLSEPTLLVNETKDEYVYSLATNTLKAYPRSIAKGDTVYVFCLDRKILATTVLGLRDANGNEVTQSQNRSVSSGQIASIEIKATGEECGTLSYLLSNSEPIAITYN